MSNYEDVFTLITQDKAYYNGSTLSDTNCATCVVACACNTANGWTSTKPTSGSYYVAKNKVNMAYKSLYNAPTTTSITTNVLTSGTQTLISQGSQAYGISTMSTASTTYNVTTTGSEPLTCYKKKDEIYYNCEYKWKIVGVGEPDDPARYDEYVLDALVCTNKDDSTDTMTYNATSSPTLKKVLDESAVVNASGSKANFEVRVIYHLNSFSEQAKFHPTSTLVKNEMRGTVIPWYQTATNGLFVDYDTLSADIYLIVDLVYNSKVNGYVMQINEEDLISVGNYTNYDKGNFTQYLKNANSAYHDISKFTDNYVYQNGATVGEYATRKLINSGKRYTTLGDIKNSYGADISFTGKPELISLQFAGDDHYGFSNGIRPMIKYNDKILSKKDQGYYLNSAYIGNTIYYIHNPEITRDKDSSYLDDLSFYLNKNIVTHVYATYKADSYGNVGTISHPSIKFNSDDKANRHMLTDILGGINANVTLGDRNGSWDYSGIKTVISPERYNIVEEGDGYDYNYEVVTILCSLEDIYENQSYFGNFHGGHNEGLAHGYVIQFGMCENCGCLYNNSATTESEIFKNIRDTEYGPSDTLDLFVYGLDSSGQPTNEVYYVKGTSIPEAEDKCPSGYYEYDAEQHIDRGYTGNEIESDGLRCVQYQCPKDYVYVSDIDNPSTAYFVSTNIPALNEGQCHKITGCKTGYTFYRGYPGNYNTCEYGCSTDECIYNFTISCSDGYAGGEFELSNYKNSFYCLKTITCPSGYYNQSTLESGWNKAFTYTSQTVGSLTCIKPTGCRYTETIDTNKFTQKTVTIGSDTCSYANGCVNDNGYYKLGEIPAPYFTTDSVVTLPQTCYYVTGCNGDQSFYSSDKFVSVTNPDAFIEDKSTIKMIGGTELTCQRHTCNLADEWGTLCSPSSSGTCISANANYIRSCEYNEFAGEPVCSYYLNRCYKALDCSAISTSTLKCGGVSCNSSQHFVFAKGALPGAFVGQPTSERDCYEYLTKASANATTCGDSSELTCTLNSDQIGPSEGRLYTCTLSYMTDIYGKKLNYTSCSVDIAIVDPEPDNPEIGGGGNSNGNGIFDFIIDSNTGAVEMIKNNYHKMCGKEC